MAKITEKKREAMFDAWQEKQSMQYVAEKVHISRPTVRRYREKDKWDQRTAQIKAKAQTKNDNELAKQRAHWAKQGLALQRVGMSKFYDETGRLRKRVVEKITGTEGIRAVVEGIRVQREALGEPGEITQMNVQIELVDGD